MNSLKDEVIPSEKTVHHSKTSIMLYIFIILIFLISLIILMIFNCYYWDAVLFPAWGHNGQSVTSPIKMNGLETFESNLLMIIPCAFFFALYTFVNSWLGLNFFITAIRKKDEYSAIITWHTFLKIVSATASGVITVLGVFFITDNNATDIFRYSTTASLALLVLISAAPLIPLSAYKALVLR